MGMFDYLQYRGKQYQTKDTPQQSLDTYKIEQDQDSGHWRLWHEEYDAEWIEEEGLFGGSLKQSNHRWIHCDKFDGLIRFYWYKSEQDQEEYESLFMDGQMLKIKNIHREPLTKWLEESVEAKKKKNE